MRTEGEAGRFGQTTGDRAWRAQERADLANEERFEDEIAAPLRAQTISAEAFVSAGVVSRQELDGDQADIAKFKGSERFEKIEDREATTLEFVLQKMFEDGIFGDTVKYAFKTTEFDDTTRGVDIVIDIGDEKNRVLLGVDATVSKDPAVLTKKIERNLSAITRNKLPAVKYYMDIDGNLKREQTMPRVILGLDRETTIRLRNLLLENPEALVDDIAVQRLIEQMIGQLEFAYRIARPDSPIQRTLLHALRRLEKMCNEKGLELDELAQAFKDDGLANPQQLVSRV